MQFFRQCFLAVVFTQWAAASAAHADSVKHPLSSKAKMPNIVLITLDTTRADRMGFLGSKRGLTLNLDGLARDSSVFVHAYAQAPLTSASHATILTGTYPQFHGVLDFPMALPKGVPDGPELLRTQGYQTAAFVGSYVLDPKASAPGFDRGFDTYDANFKPDDHAKQFHKSDRYNVIERRGDEVVAHALAWLDKHPKGPFFVWIHLYDAHYPYEPPEPYKTRYSSEPYDGAIAYEDAVVGGLLKQLKRRNLYNDAIIAVMADHGESLGAHGENTHGVFLYDETIHIPLLIKSPAGKAEHIDNRVELADVMPTLLQAAGIKAPPEMQGESLLGLVKGERGAVESWHDRPAYARADYTNLAFGWSVLQSWRAGKYLYVQAPYRELYDVTADAKSEHNLAPSSTAVADTMAANLDAFRDKTSDKREASETPVDPEMAQKLAALGYIVTDTSVRHSSEFGADPKDKIDTIRTVDKLNSAMEDRRFEEAIPLLEKLISEYPTLFTMHFRLGESYMELKQYDKAIPALRKTVELHPGFTRAEMDLGQALLNTQDYGAASEVYERVLARIPTFIAARMSLEIAYAGTNRLPETIEECERVLAVIPDHYPSYLIMGVSRARSGDFEAAVSSLKQAAALKPDAPQPHTLLAGVYEQMGREGDAEREWEQAKHLGAQLPASPNQVPDGNSASLDPK